MKIKSLTSIVTFLGVTSAINLSALAGPGPQPHPQSPVRTVSEVETRKVSDHKGVVVVLGRGDGKTVKSATQARSVVFNPGAHGGIAIR